MSRLIDTSRAVRKKLRERMSSPMVRLSPGLVAELSLIEVLLVELEDLDDRVSLLVVGERKNATGT